MKNFLDRPPMGWNSWDCYGASVNEDEVRANAEFMAKKLKPYGWQYIVVDIQWSEPTANSNEYHDNAALCMDNYSRLIPAPNRFPSSIDGKGFRPLADYVHSLGLKFGIHIMRGIPRQAVRDKTAIFGTNITADTIADTASICKWNGDMFGLDMKKQGAQEYINSLVSMYAEWGVDYIKADDMAAPIYHREEIEALHKAIENSGRDMILSLSPGDAPISEAENLIESANLWRMTDDFWDSWDALKKMFTYCRSWAPFRKASHYPDCDMLPLGKIGIRSLGGERNTNFTRDEQKTMLTLWCIFGSPLMFGGDLTKNDEFTESLITNSEVYKMYNTIKSSKELYCRGDEVAWSAVGEDGALYLAMFNLGDAPLSYDSPVKIVGKGDAQNCTELWTGEKEVLGGKINPHGVKLFKIK